jgi:hypothetical protein
VSCLFSIVDDLFFTGVRKTIDSSSMPLHMFHYFY